MMLRITVPSLQFPCFLPTQYLDRLVCLQQHGVWLEEALGTTTSLLSLSSGSTHCGAVFAFANCKSLLSLLNWFAFMCSARVFTDSVLGVADFAVSALISIHSGVGSLVLSARCHTANSHGGFGCTYPKTDRVDRNST